MSRDQFVDMVSESILSLPQDLKAILRVVEDPEVDDESRVQAAGALLHVLSGANAIPGMRGILAHVGDVLLLRLVLEETEKRSPDAIARHREESPELFSPLNDQMKTARDYLGELIEVLITASKGLSKLNHQGHTPEKCVHDTESSNWLYDAVHEAIVEQLEFDEDEVAREAKGVDKILPHLKSRLAAKS